MVTRLALLFPLVALSGCARPVDPYLGGGPGSRRDIPREAEAPPPEEPEAAPARHVRHVPDDAVERAALPFFGLRIKDSEPQPPEAFLDVLARAQAVCIGEHHDNPHHHWAELQILGGLLRRGAMTAREIGVGLEMVARSFQPHLHDYGDKKTTEAELLEATHWNERWGFSFALYRPMFELARSHAAVLLGLNAEKEVVEQVARGGVASLNEQTRRQHLPDLDLEDQEHRTWFERAMRAHPETGTSAENRYAVQVLWDETMAETAARWLAARHPARQLVIFAGSGHCKNFSVPQRLRRRMPSARVFSVLPVLSPTGDHEGVRATAKGYDYAFVMTASSS